MNDDDLKHLFLNEQIPTPDDNARKVALNLATAEFEKTRKNENISQGNGLLARLIGRQPNHRSKEMSFSTKKVVYGGLATACAALLVYNVVGNVTGTDALSHLEMNGARIQGTPSLSEVSNVEQTDAQEKMIIADSSMSISSMSKEVEMAPEQKVKKEHSERRAAEKALNYVTAPTPNVASPSVPTGAMVGMMASAEMDMMVVQQQEFGRDKFDGMDENQIKNVKAEPISTFSIDVDTASYSFARSSLDRGVLPQKDSIRVEEMINYFDYDYPYPGTKERPFSTNVVMKPSPWGAGKQLMTIGIKGYEIAKNQMPNSNLVFLLDTSGSMNEANKLPLLKQSIVLLLDTLKSTDTISIVVYAGSAGTVLPPTKVSDKGAILMALQNLSAGGGTAGAEGIRQAYQLAESNFDKNAVNRVILGTDGDFNVGITSQEELKDFVEREKDKGIFLSVLGFGRGNYNDAMMQALAQNGNGVAAYIDNLNEARKVLVEEATKTLFPIAKDVKIQVEFNPATVAEYRLVGYETRALKTEDFNNDKVDAGDIGAGAEVTAIYELTPVGAPTSVDPSRYTPQNATDKSVPSASGEIAFVKLRYKLPNENESKLITTSVLPDMNAGITKEAQLLNSETNWAVAVASFAQILKGGKYTGQMTYDDVLRLATESKGADPFGYRAEFITLVHKAKTAAGLEAQPGNSNGGGGTVVPQPYPYPVPMER
ncbi:MAG: VWA domain-containing protein [Alphaproteobacteria bacterium]|jgi:Ca-activated chloride channel family protein|nr:VWA domain-containing protein [Alphaproteobacteria bacterium]